MNGYLDRKGLGKPWHEDGAILITSLLLLFVLTLLGMTAMLSTTVDMSIANNYQHSRAGFYATEAGLERAVDRVMTAFDDLAVYRNSRQDPNANSQGAFIIPDLNKFQVTYTIDNPLQQYLYTTYIGTASTLHWAHSYQLNSEAAYLSDKSLARITEQIRILETPLIQYYVFYGSSGNEADLEWLPGKNMNSWGRVHSNGNVYVGCESPNTLTFRNYTDSSVFTPHSLTACGSIFYKKRKDNSTAVINGYVKIRINDEQTKPGLSTDYKELPIGGITPANWESMRGQFNDFLMIGVNAFTGITKKSTQRGGFYEQRAENPQRTTIDGIKVVRDNAGIIHVWCSRPSYHEVTGYSPPPPYADANCGAYDQREGKWVDFIVLDLYQLESWYVNYLSAYGLSLAGEGILIYTSQTPTTGFVSGTRLKAIKLARSTPAQLLDETTLATDNPLYIKGNFNTLNKRGCCLISDAINILSEAWSPPSPPPASPPTTYPSVLATNTIINAAFVSGNVPTPAGGGIYSGGLENYPRFHENWSNITCTINGCFINLWSSAQATGTWKYGTPVYTAPTRDWGWDTSFEDFHFWPPFVPSIFSVQRGAWKEL